MDAKNFTLLVVDDLSENRFIAGKILEHAGYAVATAGDGKQALQIVENTPIDLILLDIMMPGMSGFEVCKKLKLNTQTATIPVIFLTALDDIESITEGFKLGGVDYIVKPFKRTELLLRVKSHLEILSLQRLLEDSNRDISRKNIELEFKYQQLNELTQRLDKYLKDPITTMGGLIQELRVALNTNSAELVPRLDQLEAIRDTMALDMESLRRLMQVAAQTDDDD